MTKAQEVRGRRVEAIQKVLPAQAEKIFDWILDLIDTDTKRGFFCEVEVCLFNDQSIIKTTDLSGNEGTEYDLECNLLPHDKLELFKKLKEIVDNEEGFKAVLKPNTIIGNSEAIIFQVVVVTD